MSMVRIKIDGKWRQVTADQALAHLNASVTRLEEDVATLKAEIGELNRLEEDLADAHATIDEQAGLISGMADERQRRQKAKDD